MPHAPTTLSPGARAQALELCCAALIALESAQARVGTDGTEPEVRALHHSVLTLRGAIAELRHDAAGELAGGSIGVVVAEAVFASAL